MSVKIYPKVFMAGKTQKIYVQFDPENIGANAEFFIKIQPMEIYAIKHTKNYRIDEEDRYTYMQMQSVGNGLYAAEYAFFDEQRYDVKIKNGDDVIWYTHVYSVKEDLVGVQVFKGDTHLHTCRSDGECTPFEVGCTYREAGYDFMAITDHHLYSPSIEGKEIFEKLTDKFNVFRGEEVHNKHMGYFHIINFDGDYSINEILETQTDYVKKEVTRILETVEMGDEIADKYDCAYRIFVSEQIRKANGLAVMAHPYWDCYGEYHVPKATVEYLLKNGHYDALELIAGCGGIGLNGNNLQVALWEDLRAQGVKIPVLGASDSHSRTSSISLFNKQYSLVFAKEFAGIKESIKAEKSVAVLAHDPTNYLVFGQYRFVKYARFLVDEYFPKYVVLAKEHALALSKQNKEEIFKAERAIDEYKQEFFAW